MYFDLALYDLSLKDEDIEDAVKLAVKLNFSGVSVPHYYLHSAKQHINGMVLSSAIDYPLGISSSISRIHLINDVIRHGVNAIDLVLCPLLLINKEWKRFKNDILSAISICSSHNITIRGMIEYRVLFEYVFDACRILEDLGINYIFAATGYHIDAYEDNILACKAIQEKCPQLNAITNGNIWKKEQFDIAKKSGLFGIRFNNVQGVRHAWSLPIKS